VRTVIKHRRQLEPFVPPIVIKVSGEGGNNGIVSVVLVRNDGRLDARAGHSSAIARRGRILRLTT